MLAHTHTLILLALFFYWIWNSFIIHCKTERKIIESYHQTFENGCDTKVAVLLKRLFNQNCSLCDWVPWSPRLCSMMKQKKVISCELRNSVNELWTWCKHQTVCGRQLARVRKKRVFSNTATQMKLQRICWCGCSVFFYSNCLCFWNSSLKGKKKFLCCFGRFFIV